MGRTAAKLKAIQAAKVLRKGALLGHYTSTLAGIAADAQSAAGIAQLQLFKQRQAPFLLLADSIKTALQQAIYLSPALRRLAKKSWPGSVTLVFPATKRLPSACYWRGCVALRVDGDQTTRTLAKACGGLLLSSSFNRKGKDVAAVNYRQRYRWHKHLKAVLSAQSVTSGQASTIFRLRGSLVQRLR